MSVVKRFSALARYNVLTPVAVLAVLAAAPAMAQTLTIDADEPDGVYLPGYPGGPNPGGPYDALINNSSITNTTGDDAVSSDDHVESITNGVNGTVTGDDAHAFWFGDTFGTFTNNGVIENSGTNAAIRFNAAAEKFINNKTISSADDTAISFGGTLGTFANNADGSISTAAARSAIEIDGRVLAFENAGMLSNSAQNNSTVYLNDGAGSFRNLSGGQITNTLGTAVGLDGTKSGTFSNAGTINGNHWEAVNVQRGITSFVNEAGGRIENTNAGTELGGSAVGFQTDTTTGGVVDSFTNYGTLIGGTSSDSNDQGPTVGFHSDSNSGSGVAHQVGTFFNAGSITGPGTGINFNGGVSSFTNAAGGTITSTSNNGVNSNGPIGTFNNAGTITGANNAVSFNGTVTTFINSGKLIGPNGAGFDSLVTSFNNSGTVSATTGNGVNFNDGVTSFTSSGSITSTSDNGVRINNSNGITVTNSGTISGVTGLAFDNATGGNTVVNSGTITGTGGNAIAFDWGNTTEDDTLRILTGSKLMGRVQFGDGADTFDFSGFKGTTVVEVRSLESTIAGDNTFVSALDNNGNGAVGIFDQSGTTAIGGAVAGDVVGAIQGVVGGALDGVGAFAPPTQPSAYVEPARLGGAAGAAEQAVLTELDTAQNNGAEVWGQVFGGGSRDDAPVALAHVYGGIVAGSHTQLTSNTRLGGLLGVAGSNYDIGNGTQRIATQVGVLGIYGETDLGAVVIDYSLLGGGAGHTSTRDVLVLGTLETLRANFSSWFISPSLGVTIPLLADDGATVNIAASASYAYGQVSGYTETGSTLSIAVGSVPVGVFDGRLELNGTKLVGATEHGDVTLRGKVGVLVQANTGGSNVPVTFSGGNLSAATSFTNAGSTSFGGYAGAGLSADIAQNVVLDVSGDVLLRTDGLASIGGKIGLTGSF